MSRTNRFLQGVGVGYAHQILVVFAGLWLTPFLLHRIGQHDFGLWMVGTQLMAYLAVLDFGIIALLPRETAFATGHAKSTGEAPNLDRIVGRAMRLVIYQMPVVVIAAIIAWLAMPADWEALRHPIGAVLLAYALTFPLRIFQAVLQGLQDFGFLGRVHIAAFILSTATTVVLVLLGWGLYSLVVGWMTLQLLTASASYYRLRKHFPSVFPGKLPKLHKPEVRTRLHQGFWVTLNQLASVLLSGTEILIIGKFFGPAAVVPYVCTGKLISVLSNQPTMLMAAAGPALSEMRMSESRERLSRVCIALGQAMLMVSGGVVCLVLIVNQGFVTRWVGGNLFGGFWLTALILLNMLLRHWNLTVGYALLSFGFERHLCLTAILDGAVSVSAVAILVSLYGPIGAPVGLVLGVCLVSLPLNLSALAREGELSLLEMLRPLAAWFIRFFVLVIATGAIARLWTPSTVPLLAVSAALTGFVYAAVMFPLSLRDPLGIYVRPRLLQLRTRLMGVLRPRTSN